MRSNARQSLCYEISEISSHIPQLHAAAVALRAACSGIVNT